MCFTPFKRFTFTEINHTPTGYGFTPENLKEGELGTHLSKYLFSVYSWHVHEGIPQILKDRRGCISMSIKKRKY